MRKTAVILVVLLTLGVLVNLPQAEEPQYNVVFITVDALRADHLGTYGYSRNTSPNIDRFASESTVFMNTTSPSATTILSMPSVFTSLYPVRDGVVPENPAGRSPSWRNELSLVGRFQEAGYQTKGIVAHEYVKSRYGFDRYFDSFDDDFIQGMENHSENSSMTNFGLIKRYWNRRTGGETSDLARSYLEKEAERPFFLWLHYAGTHSPYMPPEKKYLERFREPYNGSAQGGTYYYDGQQHRLSGEEVQDIRNGYDAEIAYNDAKIQEVLQELERQGMYENTIVVLTADHGECLGEHGIFNHNFLYRCSLKVPLIVHVPGKQPERVERPVSTIDVMPTLLELAGIEREGWRRGENLFSQDHRSYQYAENRTHHIIYNYGSGNPLRDIEEESIELNASFENRDLPGNIRERLEELGYSP